MPENHTYERRLYQREKVELIARYFIQSKSVKYMGCTIVNLSRNGAGALFPGKEKLQEDDLVVLDIIAPVTFRQLQIVGTVKRAQKRGRVVYAGISFLEILPYDDFKILCTI
jgi:hypothetical protein